MQAPAKGSSGQDRPLLQRWWGYWQECSLGYREEFVPRPLGQSIYAHFQIQVARGQAARMVLYRYDFVGNTAELNLHGRDQLAKIEGLLTSNPAPILIERTPDTPWLAEGRRLAVLRDLTANGLLVSPDRVVIGLPPAIGLGGVEAELIYQNLLNQTQTGGIRGGQTGTTSGTTTPGAGRTGTTSSTSSTPQQ
jgi:hypothetical protein